MNEKEILEKKIRVIANELNLYSGHKESLVEKITQSRKELGEVQDILDELSKEIISSIIQLSKIKE